jgi:hypothetical protein
MSSLSSADRFSAKSATFGRKFGLLIGELEGERAFGFQLLFQAAKAR